MSTLSNKYLPLIGINFDDLITSNLYITHELKTDKHTLTLKGCKFIFCYQINEIPDTNGDLSMLVDLKVEVPSSEIISVSTHFSIYMLYKDYSKDSFDLKNCGDYGRCLCNKSYTFDDGRQQGSGPFLIGNYSSNYHRTLNQIESDYRGEENIVRLVVKLNTIRFDMDKNYLAKQIFLMMAPEEFSQIIRNYQEYLIRLENEKNEKKRMIKTNQALIGGIESTIKSNDKFNQVNRVNEVVTEVNQRFRSKVRSNTDRIEQLKICLADYNLIHFLKKMDLNRPKEVESELQDLKKLSIDQLYDLYNCTIDVQDDIIERLNELEICGICYSEPKNVVLTPCGHMFFCQDCTTGFTGTHKLCPQCRQPYLGMETIEI